jgi:hypothetical protein
VTNWFDYTGRATFLREIPIGFISFPLPRVSVTTFLETYLIRMTYLHIYITHRIVYAERRRERGISSFQSQSYIRTAGQSASLSWCQTLVWGPRSDIYYCQTPAGLLMWVALFNERTGLSFTIAIDPRQRSHSRVRVPRDS